MPDGADTDAGARRALDRYANLCTPAQLEDLAPLSRATRAAARGFAMRRALDRSGRLGALVRVPYRLVRDAIRGAGGGRA